MVFVVSDVCEEKKFRIGKKNLYVLSLRQGGTARQWRKGKPLSSCSRKGLLSGLDGRPIHRFNEKQRSLNAGVSISFWYSDIVGLFSWALDESLRVRHEADPSNRILALERDDIERLMLIGIETPSLNDVFTISCLWYSHVSCK